MNKQNYQIFLDETIKEIQKNAGRPSLLLHACCAPCSSYVIEYLSCYFDITILYYNPNISPVEEYSRREKELRRMVLQMQIPNIKVVSHEYDPEPFDNISKGLENQPEGGKRCLMCYELRLDKSASYAAHNKFDYITTTLTISPMKNSQAINQIGKKVAEKYNISYLFSDFKKKNGYLRSIQLSEEYSLYRQDYCGCIFSKRSDTE